MKIRLDKDKKAGLILTAFMMITAPFFFYLTDGTKPIKTDLEKLFEQKFDKEQITSIIERPYTGARGNLNFFKTKKSSKYYPILLDKKSYHQYELFKEGLFISKEKDSYNIILNDNIQDYHIKLQNPTKENLLDALNPIVFFGGFFLIQLLFIPNSYYENRRNKSKRRK